MTSVVLSFSVSNYRYYFFNTYPALTWSCTRPIRICTSIPRYYHSRLLHHSPPSQTRLSYVFLPPSHPYQCASVPYSSLYPFLFLDRECLITASWLRTGVTRLSVAYFEFLQNSYASPRFIISRFVHPLDCNVTRIVSWINKFSHSLF